MKGAAFYASQMAANNSHMSDFKDSHKTINHNNDLLMTFEVTADQNNDPNKK